MSAQRVCIGRDVRVLAEQRDGVELEGELRLRPGRLIEVVAPGAPPRIRLAVVWSWYLMTAGSNGLAFRGFCRWQ